MNLSSRFLPSSALLGTLFIALSALPALATTYFGNGATGFGGPIGNGSLSVTSDGTNVNFSLTTGVSFSGNVLALYIDSVAGGVGNTSTFTDTGDNGRRALSGLSDSGRTLAQFPAGFSADFGITVEPGFSGLFNLSNTANFGYLGSGGLSGSGTGPFTFAFPLSSLGLSPTDDFQFVGSLISGSAYRSNETFGTSTTSPGSQGDAPNAGFTGTTAFSTAYTFDPVPEPGSSVLLTITAAAFAGGARRRLRQS